MGEGLDEEEHGREKEEEVAFPFVGGMLMVFLVAVAAQEVASRD